MIGSAGLQPGRPSVDKDKAVAVVAALGSHDRTRQGLVNLNVAAFRHWRWECVVLLFHATPALQRGLELDPDICVSNV